MLKANITAGSYVAGASIPITLAWNTNDKTQIVNNSIQINTSGLWNVKANAIITALTTDPITLQLFADGVAVPSALATLTPVAGSTYTMHINDAVRTVLTQATSKVKLSFQATENVTLVGGDVIISYNK